MLAEDVQQSSKEEESPTLELNSEPSKLDSMYDVWAVEPTHHNLYAVVKELQPTIDYTLSQYGVRGDSLIEGEARLVAAKAVRKYDPAKGAGLKTYLSSQLQQLQRKIRRLREPIRIPERQTLDAAALQRMHADFIEEKGYEPSTVELSNYAGISPERITKLRALPRIASDARFSSAPTSADSEADGMQEATVYKSDWLDDAMRYVYIDAEPLDQKIFEGMTGYLGAETRTPAELAERLNVSQSQISRRFARMMSNLQDIEKELGDVYGND